MTLGVESVLLGIVNVAFIFMAPLLLIGAINRVKARWAGRCGPRLWQPFYDVRRLLQKGQVISKTTSSVFQIAPSVGLAATLTAALVTPLMGHSSLSSFGADFVFWAYILALAKFMMVAAAMDTGSPFEGMGASREVTLHSLVEPAFFMIMATLALVTNSTSFHDILRVFSKTTGDSALLAILSVLSLGIMLLVEGCRVPVDDPNTHLELTMIHEVMVLDNSGPDLAMITYSSALKMVLLGSLITNLLIPPELNIWVSSLILIAALSLLAFLIGTLETVMARLRMTHLPQFVFLMTSMGLVAAASALFFK